MFARLPAGVLAGCLLGPSLAAQFVVPISSQAEFTGATQLVDAGRRVELDTRLASGSLTVLVAAFDEATIASGPWPILVPLPLALDGSQELLAVLPSAFPVPPEMQIYVRNLFLEGGALVSTPTVVVPLGVMTCATLDFDVSPLHPMQSGEIVAEQYASLGIHISCENGHVGHPDKAIIFDSSAPTGGDFDLATPGTGTNNTEALGKLLIIAENVKDTTPADGFVDDPDDENDGGELIFDFDEPTTLCGLKVVDVDDSTPSKIKFWAGATALPDQPIRNLGNNSVVQMAFLREGVTRMAVCLGGSGGIPSFDYLPCPGRIDFDSDAFGQPLGLVAGTVVTTQIPGVTVAADNAKAGHPDMALIFDSAARTGGDTDLLTPGWHPSNTVPLHKVLIIAENAKDTNPADGIMDDPDDEGAGGVLRLTFDTDRRFVSATVLDIDTGENSFLKLYAAGGGLIKSIPLAAPGNNSVQVVLDDVSGVRILELCLSGSGALAEVHACPEGGPAGTP